MRPPVQVHVAGALDIFHAWAAYGVDLGVVLCDYAESSSRFTQLILPVSLRGDAQAARCYGILLFVPLEMAQGCSLQVLVGALVRQGLLDDLRPTPLILLHLSALFFLASSLEKAGIGLEHRLSKLFVVLEVVGVLAAQEGWVQVLVLVVLVQHTVASPTREHRLGCCTSTP